MSSSRPNSVKLAIVFLSTSFVVSLVQTLMRVTAGFKKIGFWCEIFGFLIILFLIVMIYQRKNWARWMLASCVVFWLVTLVVRFRFLTWTSIFDGILLAMQLALWIGAALLLFAPTANNWFRLPKESALNQG
jgi:hypothetical protein